MFRKVMCLIFLMLATSGCGDVPEGQVTIRLLRTLPADGILTSLTVPIADVSLQPAGIERDAGGYIPLVQRQPAYAIVDGAPIVIGAGSAPSGAYERIFVEVAGLMLEGTGSRGESISVENHVEPIAVFFDVVPGEHRVIDLELIILKDFGGEAPSYTLFCKDVSVIR